MPQSSLFPPARDPEALARALETKPKAKARARKDGPEAWPVPVVRVQLSKVSEGPTLTKGPMRNAEEVIEFFRSFLGHPDRELVAILMLDIRNTPIACQVVAMGTIDQCQVYPREIVKSALLANAANVILCHNHPSGKVDPSAEDEALTNRIHAALKLLDIRLLDHVIINTEGKEFFSFRNSGCLK